MGVNRTRPQQYQMRLPEDLHQWLKANAEKNYRTLSAEIHMHLENARKAIEQEEKHNVATN